MLSKKFKGHNLVLAPPIGVTDGSIGHLHAFKHPQGIISCWELSEGELEQINKTKEVWLSVMSNGHPPVSLTPFVPMQITAALTELKAFTCFECDKVNNCKYAWDPYNRNGDCLAEK